MTSTNSIRLSTATFQAEVLESATPALVDFSASRCAPCRQIAPAIEAIAAAYRGRLRVGVLDVDDHPEIAERYGVRSIPTLLLFRNGRVVAQLVGSGPVRRIEEAIRRVL